MNKEKVMQAVYELSDLQSICSKSMRQKAINKVKSEIDSKPLMPEVFDDWYKYYKERAQDTYYLLQDFNEVIIGQTQLFDGEVQIAPDEDVNLYRWMWEGNSFEYSKYLMCVEAIIDGYEVDDDE